MSVCSDVRKPADQRQGQGYGVGYIDDPFRATTCLRLIEPHQFSFKRAEACLRMQERQPLILSEFPGVHLPAFWHTLDALKMISRNTDVRFTEIIVPSSTSEADGCPVAPQNTPAIRPSIST
jgi:hypothetical protein